MAHFDAYLRYSDVLILSSAVPAGRRVWEGVCAPPENFLIITNKLNVYSWGCERTAAVHRSPQNNAFDAVVMQFWCIISCIRLPVLKQSKNFLGDWGGGRPSKYAYGQIMYGKSKFQIVFLDVQYDLLNVNR